MAKKAKKAKKAPKKKKGMRMRRKAISENGAGGGHEDVIGHT